MGLLSVIRSLIHNSDNCCFEKKYKLTGGNTLDTATTCETANGGLGDALDIVAKNLAVTLGTTLAETFSTFAT